jgi:hypothetical protein
MAKYQPDQHTYRLRSARVRAVGGSSRACPGGPDGGRTARSA